MKTVKMRTMQQIVSGAQSGQKNFVEMTKKIAALWLQMLETAVGFTS
jgi:hypothetical protein